MPRMDIEFGSQCGVSDVYYRRSGRGVFKEKFKSYRFDLSQRFCTQKTTVGRTE